MTTSPTVSVIIPTYNRADLLKETIEAVFAQSRAPEEILVVDDGSEDHTSSIVREFGSRIQLLSKPNSGKADSLNQAISASSGSYIWIVDDDDLPRPDALATLTTLLAANPDAELVYGRHIRFENAPSDREKTYQETGYWEHCAPDRFLIVTLEDFFVHQPAMLAARALYDRAGAFNTDMIASEDYEMLIRLAQNGDVAATDKIIFEQRVHAGVRGQKGHQFAAADRNAKWIDYDQRIFRSVHQTLPVEAYLPRGADVPLTPASTRQALIQRACIFARKKLWTLALTDLSTVATGGLQTPLSDAERTMLRRALFSKYGCDEILTDPEIAANLQKIGATGPLGRALSLGIARGLLWHIRTQFTSGKLGMAWRFARLYLKLK